MVNRYLLIVLMVLLTSCQHNAVQDNEKKQSAAARNRDAAVLNTQLGMEYLKQGNRQRAKRKLLYALELAPRLANANAAMGYFQEQSGDKVNAERYYRKALKYSDNNGAQLNNFGTFLCRMGKYKDAEKYFLKAVKDVNYIHSAGAYENAGLCAEAIPNHDKAVHYFTMALKQEPDRKQSLNELIAIAKKKGDNKKILSYIEQYITLVYNDPGLLKTAKEVASKEGKTELATFYQQRLATYNQFGAKNDNNG